MQSAEELSLPGYHLMDTDWTHLKSESVDQAWHTLCETPVACRKRATSMCETMCGLRGPEDRRCPCVEQLHGESPALRPTLVIIDRGSPLPDTRMCRATRDCV